MSPARSVVTRRVSKAESARRVVGSSASAAWPGLHLLPQCALTCSLLRLYLLQAIQELVGIDTRRPTSAR